MRVMSLNTHSWLEENPFDKLKETADFIIENKIDLIALQEINQHINSQIVTNLDDFCSVENQQPIKEDNYALLLVNYLREKGLTYNWGWTYSHIGYDIYEEGSAILSLKPFEAESLLVSPMNDPKDYHTRKLLLAHFEDSFSAASCHFSWWDKDEKQGFYYEWQKLMEKVAPIKHQVLLLGDFNAPAHIKSEGYSLVNETFYDVYSLAKERIGSYTVDEEIDGWEDNEEKLRIDFGFLREESQIETYQVIFNNQKGPIVSDHFGIMIDM